MLGALGGWKGVAKAAGKLAVVLIVAWVLWDYIDTKLEEQSIRRDLAEAKAQAERAKELRQEAEEARAESQTELQDLRAEQRAAERDARIYRRKWEALKDDTKELREWAAGPLPGHVADRMRQLTGPGPDEGSDEGKGEGGGPPGGDEAGAAGGADPAP